MAHYAAGLSDAGKSARTVQAAIGAAKSFTRWLVTCEKLPRDPLASVSKPSPEANRRRERRMLLPSEWPYLLAATLSGPVRNGMDGPDRALLYPAENSANGNYRGGPRHRTLHVVLTGELLQAIGSYL
ncbi:site-specific integrase [Lacipirellula limnantheis]|uniref:Core-binding (CB) domain-containing protein n=1 Tax=Lacipirellula limnantheis TaxID=2528024 RepID=A0A517TZ70_9BACT|nr:hypothetical protein [Lacipirellula limnantheis]QDT73655.1 hypothetical protein I41_28450 [Lacipirellula limnantheis]